ncbi:MAG: glycerate kinase [Anaerolineales bacterium]|nr:glycerate kinase [Anaerolineales bacterium]MCB9146394.1 glycerate kinase [Anaerolineales bacterium]
MKNISTATLHTHPHGKDIMQILNACINAVEPGNAIRNFVRREKNILQIEDQKYDLNEFDQVTVLGLGKATEAMSLALLDVLGSYPSRGLLIPKQAFTSPASGFTVSPGGHPVPTAASIHAGNSAFDLASTLTEKDLLICLISGGGSALMTSPQRGLQLEDLQALTKLLLACGARVDEINTLRRHLDRVKGGGIAKSVNGARIASLILSDVVANPLEAIASGPTAPDPSTREDALSILKKYDLLAKVPAAILQVLENTPETPKPNDPLFERVQNVLVGSNSLAAEAGLEMAKSLGFETHFLGDTWQGEAREVAKKLCRYFKREYPRPFCWIAGGETTVTLHGRGKGGRNQELALAAAIEMNGLENSMLITLATDGEDGPTDAAGAVVVGESYQRGERLGVNAQAFLSQNDAHSYFEKLGDLLQTGPTGTNVNDLTILFGF